MSDTQINIEFRGKPGVAGVNWRGEWTENATYRERDLVELDGTVYVAAADPDGAAPPAEPWELFADTTAATQAAQQAAQSAADAETAAENAALAALHAAVRITASPLYPDVALRIAFPAAFQPYPHAVRFPIEEIANA